MQSIIKRFLIFTAVFFMMSTIIGLIILGISSGLESIPLVALSFPILTIASMLFGLIAVLVHMAFSKKKKL